MILTKDLSEEQKKQALRSITRFEDNTICGTCQNYLWGIDANKNIDRHQGRCKDDTQFSKVVSSANGLHALTVSSTCLGYFASPLRSFPEAPYGGEHDSYVSEDGKVIDVGSNNVNCLKELIEYVAGKGVVAEVSALYKLCQKLETENNLLRSNNEALKNECNELTKSLDKLTEENTDLKYEIKVLS